MRLDSSLHTALYEQGCLRYPGPKTGYRHPLGLKLIIISSRYHKSARVGRMGELVPVLTPRVPPLLFIRFLHTHNFSWCSQRARDTALYGLQSVPPPLTATYPEPRLLLLMRPFMTIHEESYGKDRGVEELLKSA